MFKKRIGRGRRQRNLQPSDASSSSFVNKNNDLFAPKNKTFFVENLDFTDVPGDSRPHITVDIFGRHCVGLLDSGSAVTLLSSEVANFLLARGLKSASEDIYLRTADGTNHSATQYFDVPIQFNNQLHVLKCYLVPSMSSKLLLGMNFWHKFGLAPSLKKFEFQLTA